MRLSATVAQRHPLSRHVQTGASSGSPEIKFQSAEDSFHRRFLARRAARAGAADTLVPPLLLLFVRFPLGFRFLNVALRGFNVQVGCVERPGLWRCSRRRLRFRTANNLDRAMRRFGRELA